MDETRDSIWRSYLPYAKLVLGVSLLALLLLSMDFKEFAAIVKASRPVWLLISAVAAFVTLDLQVLLFGYIVSPFARIPHGKLLVFTLIGRFFSLFLPSAVGGDVVKVFYLVPYFANGATAYAAVAVQRTIGGLSTLAMAVIAGLIYFPETERAQILWVGVVIGITTGIVATALWTFKGQSRLVIDFLRAQQETLVGRHIWNFLNAVLAYRHQGLVVGVAFVLSAFITIIAAWMYMLLAYTLRIDLAFGQALVITSVTMLSVLLPLTPGGIGVSEGAFVITATTLGFDPEEALAIALLGRFLNYVCSLPGGFLYLQTRTQ